jgi:hypothetical protein
MKDTKYHTVRTGTSKSRNTPVKAVLHLENAEIHLKIVQMNLQMDKK